MKRAFDTLIDFGALTPKVNSTLEISNWITELFNDINMPVKLNEVGITREDIGTIATDSMEDFPIHSNVRKVTDSSEIVDLLSSVL
jgi:alcohol dehydrogenase class IV